MKKLFYILLIGLMLISVTVTAQTTQIDGSQVKTGSIAPNKITGDVYTKAETNSTIEAAIAAITSLKKFH